MGNNKLRDVVARLPESCGVYLFKDAGGKIIYIGKAKSLKKRVQTYFSRQLAAKTQAMVGKIAGIEHILTPSEAQAQILEAALVREKQPQYNISLKDDKTFPWIKITDEDFPTVSIARRKTKEKGDTSTYFGPYTNVKLLRQAFKILRRIFGFRSCKNLPKRSCLYFRLRFCPAPCVGEISSGEYKETIKEIKMFLRFRHDELLDKLTSKMQELSRGRRFEEAARVRDQLNALSALGQNKTASFNESEDLRELLGLTKLPQRIEAFDISNISGREATGSMVSFYNGRPDKNNYRRFRIKTVEEINDYEMLREIIKRRYQRLVRESQTFPDLILIDGGKGHLTVAQEEIKGLGLDIPLVSIAKDKENIYIQGRLRPIRLKSDTSALNFIRRVRDEAHRFALAYHHLLRSKKVLAQ